MGKKDGRSTTGTLMHEILQTEIGSGKEIMVVVMTDNEVLVLTKGSWTKATDRKKGVRAISNAIEAGWPDLLGELVEGEFTERAFEIPRPPSAQTAPLMDDPPRDFKDDAARGHQTRVMEGGDGPF